MHEIKFQLHPDITPRARHNAPIYFARVIDKFGNGYDYSKSLYKNGSTKIEISCPIPDHPSYFQTPSNHESSTDGGCAECKKAKCRKLFQSDIDSFVRRARLIWGDSNNYNDSIYINMTTMIEIECVKHGKFSQLPSGHLKGHHGCKECLGWIYDTKSFKRIASVAHNDWYDYDESIWVNNTTLISIRCPDHGTFLQLPNDHVSQKSGCLKCKGFYIFDTTSFKTRMMELRGDQYIFTDSIYVNAKAPIIVRCPTHGLFKTTSDDMINLTIVGCPGCRPLGTDNDTIYLLKAIGLADTYKIGVTSKRLNDSRIDKLEAASGLTFETIRLAPTKCRATELETKLLRIGERPFMDKFAGYTEFRVLREHELKWVVDAIDQHTL